MNAFVDIHHHILYGLDDGPANPEQAEQMLLAAYREGVRTIIATPHIAPGIRPFSCDTLYRQVEATQRRCTALGLDLSILPGAEVLYTCQTERYLAQRRIPTMAGSGKVLVEFPPSVRFDELETAVRTLLRGGYIPILAHIERYPCLMAPGQRAARLKEQYDVQYQINGGLLLRNGHGLAARRIRRLFLTQQIDYVASDAHDCERRACCLNEAYERLVPLAGRPYADHLLGNHETVADFCQK